MIIMQILQKKKGGLRKLGCHGNIKVNENATTAVLVIEETSTLSSRVLDNIKKRHKKALSS